MTKESNTSCNHISNFQEDVMKHIKNLISQIECTTEQKKIILSKSEKILKTHISRSEKGGVNISSYMKPISLAVAIIYTIVVSNENMPKISSTFLANFANLASSVAITKYYRKHFQEFYPRSDFSFTIHKFGRIRLIFSNYIFKLIKSKKIETSEIIFHLKEKVLKKINLPNQLNEKDVETLFMMATQHEDTFIKYFSDLAEIIKQLIISSNVHKKIGAHLIINNIAELLKERGIHLYTPSELSKAMVEIFDFLKKNNPNFFPNRAYTQDADIFRKEYAKIVGSKLKIFMMNNMYNRKYLHNGIVKCPKCLEEGLIINTDISRLKSLQFHHPSENKKTQFTEKRLFDLFTQNQSNPHVLEYIMNLMESERVNLICNNHHSSLSYKNFNDFKYLINWKEIFDYQPEIIYTLIRISVDNFRKTKNLSHEQKKTIRKAIVENLKKRFIIEKFYGEVCHVCEEFSIRDYLNAFHFSHLSRNTKNYEPSDLFHLSCSKIVEILEEEKGGYICANCHNVLDFKNVHLADKIYRDNKTAKKVLTDYNRALNKFYIISTRGLLFKNPLEKTTRNNKSLETYLYAIYNISNSGIEVTNRVLAQYQNIKNTGSVWNYFNRNKVIKEFLNINSGARGQTDTKYSLNSRGRNIIYLLEHFRKYYNSI